MSRKQALLDALERYYSHSIFLKNPTVESIDVWFRTQLPALVQQVIVGNETVLI
jgi:hypothetical protein